MTPHTHSSAAPRTFPSVRLVRATATLILTALTTASGILMIGPQIMIIVPMAIVAGIVFAIRRSFWSLVCFGYPLIFGLISAWIGYKEMPGYERTVAFAVSIGLGIVGISLVATGLWRVGPVERKKKPTDSWRNDSWFKTPWE